MNKRIVEPAQRRIEIGVAFLAALQGLSAAIPSVRSQFMKTIILVSFLLSVLSAGLMAQETPTQTRSFQQYGALVTWGQDSGLSASNWGLSIRSFTFLDAAQTEGVYYTILSGALIHSVDAISFADMRLFGLGWRGDPVKALGLGSSGGIGFDLGLAPTAELRLKPHEIALGSASLGMGATLGLYLPLAGLGDIGISWEPVVDLRLLSWGERSFRDANYSDFVLSWVVKSRTETRTLPWANEAVQ